MIIFILFNRAPVTPTHGAWAAAAAAAIFFYRASVHLIPIVVLFSIIYRASTLSPWTPTVIRSAILRGEATPLLWASPIG